MTLIHVLVKLLNQMRVTEVNMYVPDYNLRTKVHSQ
jgi:hypothetical protein